MGFGPFAYIPFIMVFLKFDNASYDMRQQVHKTMGVISYLFILINVVTGSGMMLMDIGLFIFVSYYFYRAMTDQFDHQSRPAIAVILTFALLSVGVAWKIAPAAPKPGTKTDDQKQVEEALKKALGTATRSLQHRAKPESEAEIP